MINCIDSLKDTVKNNEKSFFHKVSAYEINKLMENEITISEIKKRYQQPKWCTYPEALNGFAGCWSLMDIEGLRKEISVEFCNDCPCFNKNFINYIEEE